MLMIDTKTKCFVDCVDLQDNTAKFNFEDNTLKLGKTSLSNQQLKRISLMFANDLKKLCRNLWQLSKSYRKSGLFLLAKQSLKQPREEVEKYFFFLNSKCIQYD